MTAAHELTRTSPMTMTAVAILVAQAHGLSLEDLRGPTRDRHVVAARREAMCRLRQAGLAGPEGRQYKIQEIADFFGVSYQAVHWALLSAPPELSGPGRVALAPKPMPMAGLEPGRRSMANHAAAFDALFAQAYADGGFGALHRLIEEARSRLSKRHQSEIFREGWIC